jgi:hypothetical protein
MLKKQAKKFRSAEHKRQVLADMAWKEKNKSNFNLDKAPSILKPQMKAILDRLNSRPSNPLIQINHGPTQVEAPTPTASTPNYSGDMARREEMAQKEIKKKQLQVAPVANKMGYQYIHNPEDYKTMGRKT